MINRGEYLCTENPPAKTDINSVTWLQLECNDVMVSRKGNVARAESAFATKLLCVSSKYSLTVWK